MTIRAAYLGGGVTLLSVLTANTAAAQLMSTCVENSPERRGQMGCTVIESKVLPDGLKEPLFGTLTGLIRPSVRARPLAQRASHSRRQEHRGS